MIKPAKAGKNAWNFIKEKSAATAYGTHYWDHAGNAVTENLEGDDSRIIIERAIRFIEDAAARNKPFFAAIWFHAPHLLVVAGEKHIAPNAGHDVYERNYYGCVTALNEQVGRLRNKLKELGVAGNTMLWFCSDNGPAGKAGKAPRSAGKLRGRKRSLCEGGVRVPGILEWPGKIEPGATDVVAVTSDFLTSVLVVLGADYPDQLIGNVISTDRVESSRWNCDFNKEEESEWGHGPLGLLFFWAMLFEFAVCQSA